MFFFLIKSRSKTQCVCVYTGERTRMATIKSIKKANISKKSLSIHHFLPLKIKRQTHFSPFVPLSLALVLLIRFVSILTEIGFAHHNASHSRNVHKLIKSAHTHTQLIITIIIRRRKRRAACIRQFTGIALCVHCNMTTCIKDFSQGNIHIHKM